MGLPWTAIVGLLIGALTNASMPGRDPGHLIVTMLLGMGGAVLGAFVGRSRGWYETGDAAGLLLAVAGGVVMLAVHRALGPRGRAR